MNEFFHPLKLWIHRLIRLHYYIHLYVRAGRPAFAHGRAKARRPERTYIQQLCEDTGCCPEDLPEAMNDW